MEEPHVVEIICGRH